MAPSKYEVRVRTFLLDVRLLPKVRDVDVMRSKSAINCHREVRHDLRVVVDKHLGRSTVIIYALPTKDMTHYGEDRLSSC